MKKILIIGDSHTRSFAFRKNIIPVFLGPGKKINLEPKNIRIIKKKLNYLKNIFDEAEYEKYLILGEPNIRYQLGHGWYPHTLENINSKIDTEYIEECAERLISLSLKFDSKIITPVSGYSQNLKGLLYFANYLKKQNLVNVIDIFSKTLTGSNVESKYLIENYKSDPIHLNLKISDVFIDEINEEQNEHYSIFFSRYSKNINGIDQELLKEIFSENRFNTYSLDEKPFYQKLYKKLKSILKQ